MHVLNCLRSHERPLRRGPSHRRRCRLGAHVRGRLPLGARQHEDWRLSMKKQQKIADQAAWPPNCDRCGKPLVEPGALAFGPPVLVGPQQVTSISTKHHLCHSCWGKFKRWLLGGGKDPRDPVPPPITAECVEQGTRALCAAVQP
jgi:hypothetical protein